MGRVVINGVTCEVPVYGPEIPGPKRLDGKPTTDGWYWYHDPERNFGKSMPAWVFFNGPLGYVTLCAVHESPLPDHVVSLDQLAGTWVGPMEMPR